MRTRCATSCATAPCRAHLYGGPATRVTGRLATRRTRSPTRSCPLLPGRPRVVLAAAQGAQPRGVPAGAVALGELLLDRLAPQRRASALLAPYGRLVPGQP